ncbi:hypothetical protein LCGC14_2592340, partial [marine sediment metagenome]
HPDDTNRCPLAPAPEPGVDTPIAPLNFDPRNTRPPAPESLVGWVNEWNDGYMNSATAILKLAEAIDALTVEAKSKARVHDAALNFAARDRHEQAKRIETLEAATSSARSAAHEEDHLNELADARDAAQ